MRRKSQVAIEFLSLTIIGFLILLTMIAALGVYSSGKKLEKTYAEIQDIGRTVQQELLIASEVQDGYRREIYIPESVNGIFINLTYGNTTKNTGYLSFKFENQEVYYEVPQLSGNIGLGVDIISKNNKTINISHIG